jgi:DNA-binding CsgD family transcriptional regulator
MIAERHLRRFSACVFELQHAKPGPSFVPTVLALLRRLVDAEQAFFGLTDIAAKQAVVGCALPEMLTMGVHGQHFERHFGDHPFHASPGTIMPGDAFRFSDLSANDAWERSPLCNEFFRPIGVDYQMMLRLPAPAEYAYAVGLGRHNHDFSEDDVAMLAAFRDHLLLAFARAQLVGSGPLSPPQPPSAFRMLVDDGGKIISCTPGAERRLRRFFGPPAAGGDRVPDHVRAWLADQLQRLRGLVGTPDRHLQVQRGPDTCLLVLVPDRDGGQHELLVLAECAGVHRAAPLSGRLPPTRHEQALEAAAADWHLTGRQRAVLNHLVSGKTNKEIGAALGCAEVTVEFHVTALLRKAQATGRAALVARVLTG